MRGERGVALVQVMVMSVILLLFATGVLQVIFGTHVIYTKTRTSAESKNWAEACMAEKNLLWKGIPCNPIDPSPSQCDYSQENNGVIVKVECDKDTGKVEFKVPALVF